MTSQTFDAPPRERLDEQLDDRLDELLFYQFTNPAQLPLSDYMRLRARLFLPLRDRLDGQLDEQLWEGLEP